MNQDFDLGDKKRLLKEQYEKDNFLIKNIGHGDICYIFFSSNGLYNIEQFEKTIMENDRYEWKNVCSSKEILVNADKIVFVRDIYQHFYSYGINKNINTIDKVCQLLQQICKGKRVVTCGTSSGGYMAVITGVYVRAERIYSFGGQWKLSSAQIEKSSFIDDSHFSLEQHNKYQDITYLLKDNTIPIMYFYSAFNAGDIAQTEVLFNTDRKKVFTFAMKSNKHGYLLFNDCYRKLLVCNMKKIEKICNRYNNGQKIISLRKMCLFLLGKIEACELIIKDIFGRNEL